MKSPFLIIIILILLVTSAAAETWNVTEITGPSGTTRIVPAAINESGIVVGSARFSGRTTDSAFRWENGTMTELQLPSDAIGSAANDVANNGLIVGSVTFPTTVIGGSGLNAARWSASLTSSAITLLPYNLDGDSDHNILGSSAAGINEQGLITGSAGTLRPNSSFRISVPVTSVGGGYTYLHLKPQDGDLDKTSGTGLQVNEDGTVLSKGLFGPDRAALIIGSSVSVIEIQPGLQGLNDFGHIVGTRAFASGNTQIARMWNGSAYTDLGSDNPSTPSMANSINNSDWAVGRSGVDFFQNDGGTAYIWRPNTLAVSLNSLVPSDWFLSQATDISDNNQVVGKGFHGGVPMGFVMVPSAQAFQLTGTVLDTAAKSISGVSIQVLRQDGQSVAAPEVTATDGKYTWVLPKGSYRVTALPENNYEVLSTDVCAVVKSNCDIVMDRNRIVDFGQVNLGKSLKSKIST